MPHLPSARGDGGGGGDTGAMPGVVALMVSAALDAKTVRVVAVVMPVASYRALMAGGDGVRSGGIVSRGGSGGIDGGGDNGRISGRAATVPARSTFTAETAAGAAASLP